MVATFPGSHKNSSASCIPPYAIIEIKVKIIVGPSACCHTAAFSRSCGVETLSSLPILCEAWEESLLEQNWRNSYSVSA